MLLCLFVVLLRPRASNTAHGDAAVAPVGPNLVFGGHIGPFEGLPGVCGQCILRQTRHAAQCVAHARSSAQQPSQPLRAALRLQRPRNSSASITITARRWRWHQARGCAQVQPGKHRTHGCGALARKGAQIKAGNGSQHKDEGSRLQCRTL